jgi:hypothetical protein
VLEGPYWPEPVRVLSAQMRNTRIELHVVGLQTRRYFSNLLDLEEFGANVRVRAREAALTFAASPKHFRLAVAHDEEVEAIAMEVAIAYERAKGREPEDVSAEPLGFDIRSVSPSPVGRERGPGGEGPRYIEVKGRAAAGSVALTRNEWIKAQRFGDDYWFYIVVNCKMQPQLYVLQNPAAVLRPEEELEVMRYIVWTEAWQRYAQAVPTQGVVT